MSSDAVIPLFPLPNVLLYPDAMLPLHVFEERYVQLVEDLQAAGSCDLVLGLLEPGWEDRYFESPPPPIHQVAGLGKVLHINQAKEDRYNILVQGMVRCRIVEEVESDKLYRKVRVESLSEDSVEPTAEYEELCTALKNGLIEFADGSLALKANASLGYMADLLTVALPIDIHSKQDLFSTLDVIHRAQNVLKYLVDINAQRRTMKRADKMSDQARWN